MKIHNSFFYLFSLVLFVLGLLIPPFMIFAVIVAFIPLLRPKSNDQNDNKIDNQKKDDNDNKDSWLTMFSKAKIYDNDMISKNSDENKQIDNFNRSSFKKQYQDYLVDDESFDYWKFKPSKDDEAIINDSKHQLISIIMPWEIQPSVPISLDGLGIFASETGFAFRSHQPFLSSFRIKKVGRTLHSLDSSEFESKIADNPIDENEIIMSGNENVSNRRLNYLCGLKNEANKSNGFENDIIRSGDIVCLKYDLIKESYLTVKNDWWLGFTDSDDQLDERSFFQIAVTDDKGEIKYGIPLVAGQFFKLRSAKWPRYEIGYQQVDDISEAEILPLILYEWSARIIRGPLRCKQGGTVTPFISCFVRSKLPMVSVKRKKSIEVGFSAWFKKRSKIRALQTRIIASTDIYHRSSFQNLRYVIIVSTLIISDDQSIKWTSLRSMEELTTKVNNLEDALESEKILINKKGTENENYNFIELQYETELDRNIRTLNQRIERLFRFSLEYKKTAISSSLNDVIDSSPLMMQFQEYLQAPQIADSWYLSGSAEQLGFTNTEKCIFSSVVSRAAWESHWAEEIALIYPTHISFISPLTRKPTWNLLTKELNSVTPIYGEESPFPGYSVLRVATLDQIFYLAFNTRERREIFSSKVLETMAEVEMLLISDNADGFIFYSGQWLPPNRKILNSRRFSFDQSKSTNESPLNFSIRLLKDSFILDPKCNEDIIVNDLELDLDKLTAFFDELVKLKTIDINSFDLKSPETICFFINIYHTLYMHARLVIGTPSKNDWSSFYSLSCYEIGCNVFSLLELYNCVLRGLLSQAIMPSKFEPPALLPSDDHYVYALQKTDYRINFLLNTGSRSYPNTIHLVTPANLEIQLNLAIRSILEKYLKVDAYRNTVTLPKICETYRDDFGSDVYDVLQKCLVHSIGTTLEEDLRKVISNEKRQPRLLYHTYLYESHSKMKLII